MSFDRVAWFTNTILYFVSFQSIKSYNFFPFINIQYYDIFLLFFCFFCFFLPGWHTFQPFHVVLFLFALDLHFMCILKERKEPLLSHFLSYNSYLQHSWFLKKWKEHSILPMSLWGRAKNPYHYSANSFHPWIVSSLE